jgi:3'(2'), 5'-bisphosphate nucleotidase
MNLSPLLDAVLEISLEAGRRILEVYRSDFAVMHKADASPLTPADLAAHRHIVAALAALSPALPVLSEEAADIDYAVRRGWSRYWLVDPLDGTREFVRRNGDFTVNIALIDGGFPVLGVVHAPALDLTCLAAEGVGSFQLIGGRRRALHTRRTPATPVFVVSQSHQNDALTAFLSRAPEHVAVSRGSSLKFCQIAAGEADLYPRTGPTSEWDTAAGQCVVEQAGGRVLRLPELTRLAYNRKESLLNPLFAAIGDDRHDWTPLLRTIAG